MRTLMLLTGLMLLLALPGPAAARRHGHHSSAQATLYPVGGAAVSGTVTLRAKGHGTSIAVTASGLQPDGQYVSLIYSNSTCDLEPYATDDTIGGGPYMADATGMGATQGVATDKLRHIHSVSVRLADSFQLLACAAFG